MSINRFYLQTQPLRISGRRAAIPDVIEKTYQAGGLGGVVKINFGFMACSHTMIKIARGIGNHKGVVISPVGLTYLHVTGGATGELKKLRRIEPGAVAVMNQHLDA